MRYETRRGREAYDVAQFVADAVELLEENEKREDVKLVDWLTARKQANDSNAKPVARVKNPQRALLDSILDYLPTGYQAYHDIPGPGIKEFTIAIARMPEPEPEPKPES